MDDEHLHNVALALPLYFLDICEEDRIKIIQELTEIRNDLSPTSLSALQLEIFTDPLKFGGNYEASCAFEQIKVTILQRSLNPQNLIANTTQIRRLLQHIGPSVHMEMRNYVNCGAWSTRLYELYDCLIQDIIGKTNPALGWKAYPKGIYKKTREEVCDRTNEEDGIIYPVLSDDDV